MFKRRRDEPGPADDRAPADPAATPLFPAKPPLAGATDTEAGVSSARPDPSKESPAMARPPFNPSFPPSPAPPPGAPGRPVLPTTPPPGSAAPAAPTGSGPAAPAPSSAPASPSPQSAPHPQTPGLGQRAQPQERRTLVVGKGISLQGVIQDAERLVVEGTVEAQLLHGNELAVSAGGVFKGEVEVDDCDVAGTLDGAVTARAALIVRSTGRVIGTARCRRLQVEDGGQISGRIEMITEGPAPRVVT